jgi:diacylglycerol kinase family enzyme
VAARTREIPVLSGTALYIAAVLQTLGRYSPPDFTIRTDGTTTHAKSLLIAVGNGRCAGGGFYLTPDAQVDDGLLDVCQVDEKTIFQILLLMPRVMKGKHHHVRGVKMFKTRQLHLSAETPFHVHADGEIVGENVNSVDVGLRQGELTVIAG